MQGYYCLNNHVLLFGINLEYFSSELGDVYCTASATRRANACSYVFERLPSHLATRSGHGPPQGIYWGSHLPSHTTTPTMTSMQSPIHRLPTKLLHTIRSYLDFDILDHASFSRTCNLTAALYDDITWSYICRANGIGCLDGEDTKDVKWAAVALTCAEHILVCKHPGCGAARLSRNGACFLTFLVS